MESANRQEDGFDVEQQPVRVVQSPANIVAGSSVFSERVQTHGVTVRVVQGTSDRQSTIFDRTVREGLFYPMRIRRAMQKARKVAGALTVDSQVE